MKVAFVIPFKSKRVSSNWKVSTALLQRTLGSIFNQTNDNYKVFISCNELPIESKSEKLEIISENHPVPQRWEQGHQDKYRKIKRALIEVRKMAPCYVMKLDADDLIHQNLVNHVITSCHSGYYINRGYVYADGKRWIQRLNNFHHICGSSNVVHVEEKDLPDNMDQPIGDFDILQCGHNIFEQFYRDRGKDIRKVPFRGAIYVSGSGENHSGHNVANIPSRKRRIMALMQRKCLTRSFAKKYALHPLLNYQNEKPHSHHFTYT